MYTLFSNKTGLNFMEHISYKNAVFSVHDCMPVVFCINEIISFKFRKISADISQTKFCIHDRIYIFFYLIVVTTVDKNLQYSFQQETPNHNVYNQLLVFHITVAITSIHCISTCIIYEGWKGPGFTITNVISPINLSVLTHV